MTVRMKADLDDKHRAGQTYDDFSPLMEGRLVRSGLAERLSLDEARGRVGMEPLPRGPAIEVEPAADVWLDSSAGAEKAAAAKPAGSPPVGFTRRRRKAPAS